MAGTRVGYRLRTCPRGQAPRLHRYGGQEDGSRPGRRVTDVRPRHRLPAAHRKVARPESAGTRSAEVSPLDESKPGRPHRCDLDRSRRSDRFRRSDGGGGLRGRPHRVDPPNPYRTHHPAVSGTPALSRRSPRTAEEKRSVTSATAPDRAPATPSPMTVARPQGRNAVVKLFVFVPLLALVAAVPAAWGWGLTWIDVGLAVGFTSSPVPGPRSGSTATSPTARSRPSDRCGSRWLWWATRPSRARSSSGSPTTAATTLSPTNRATRTRRGCSAPAPPPSRRVSGTPTSGGWSTTTSPIRPASPPTCSPIPTSHGSTASSRSGRR
jgi:hypothetical protein